MTDDDQQNPRKKPRQLSIKGSDGVDVKKKNSPFRIGMAIVIGYIWLISGGTCSRNARQPTDVAQPTKTIEQILPTALDEYTKSDLEFQKGMLGKGTTVYKDGQPLGYLGEVYILSDEKNEVVGFLNTLGLYDNHGIKKGNVTNNTNLVDLQGNKLGKLEFNDKKLEKIVNDEGRQILGVDKQTYYAIFTNKDPENNKEFTLTGIIVDYSQKEYSYDDEF